jgi:hypothetical protein
MAMFLLFILFKRHTSFYQQPISEHFSCSDLILIAIFLPFRRAYLTASASLQGIRSERPRLHALRLASEATSTRE